MKTFFKWLIIIVFLAGLFFLVYKVENKQTYKQPALPTTEKNAEVVNPQIEDLKYIKIGGVEVKVELAITPEVKSRGLGERVSMGANEGMLFVFKESGKYAFWMRDMKFSIDIIWITEGQEVAYIKKNVSPDSYPEIFRSDENAKYVLEVPAFFADKNNLKLGDKVEFVY